MNCRRSQRLLSLDRDEPMRAEHAATLDAHLTACADCRRHRDLLADAITGLRANQESIQTPDAQAEWRLLSATLDRPANPQRPRASRRAWIAVWSTGAALAALAVAFVSGPFDSAPPVAATTLARAEFVELGDATATPVVFVDHDSGWLIVWAEGA